jgi:hypothetical protein
MQAPPSQTGAIMTECGSRAHIVCQIWFQKQKSLTHFEAPWGVIDSEDFTIFISFSKAKCSSCFQALA